MFNEREAIKFEMEELKVQARRDFEIYLSSREARSKRYTELLNRLREIDEKERKPQVQPKQEPVRTLPVPKYEGRPELLKLERFKPNQEVVIKEPIRKNVTTVEVDPVVEAYVRRYKRAKMGDIQKHTQEHFNYKWTNFSEVMNRIVEVNPHIKRDENKRGWYVFTE